MVRQALAKHTLCKVLVQLCKFLKLVFGSVLFSICLALVCLAQSYCVVCILVIYQVAIRLRDSQVFLHICICCSRTRNSSADEIANVNFLRRRRIHITKSKKEHWLDLSTYMNTSISCPSRKLPNSVKLRGGWLLRRSRSFKVTDFGTNRKLLYDFLLLINSNLPPILHRFQVMVQFSLARVKCLTLALLLGEIPYKYRRKWYIWFFGLHFRRRKYQCSSNHFYVIRPESYRIRSNYAALRSSKVTKFGTNRKLICDFLLLINSNLPPILHRFRDIVLQRSKISIFGFPSSVHRRYRRQTDRQTDRQTTDGQTTTYSECEREFTLPKNWELWNYITICYIAVFYL